MYLLRGPRIPAIEEKALPTVFIGQENTGARSRYAHATPDRESPRDA